MITMVTPITSITNKSLLQECGDNNDIDATY